jgi:hypothetical protein
MVLLSYPIGMPICSSGSVTAFAAVCSPPLFAVG